jgi:mono/diheme cytochrome c family protein
MKYIFLWITILGVGTGVPIWAAPQHQGQMHAGGGMIGSEMVSGIQMAQAAGEAASIYSNLCASCHGAKGQGDGPAAAALNPKPRDFADCKVMAKISDDTLFKAINGGGQSVGLSAMMPPWGGSLTEQQIHELVKYIRGFCKK